MIEKHTVSIDNDLLNKALHYRWVIFWILAICYVLVYFHRLCPAVLALDIMKDLKTGGTLTGLLASAYFYPYAAMQLPAGLLSDSWGPRKTITLFFGIAFIGSLFLGTATTVTTAILGRALVGLGVAMLFVPAMKILAEWFQAREFAFMTGILMAMGGVGSLTAATPLVWLSAWVGWRFSFIIVGIFTLILAVCVWIFVRNRPADMGLPSPLESSRKSSDQTPIRLIDGVKKVLYCPHFYPIAVWFFFTCGIFFSFGGLWGGPYLTQVYGLSKQEAGRILSMLAIGLTVGSPLVSYLSNNIFRGRKLVVIISGVIVLALTGALAFLTDKLPIVWLYLICLGLGIFSSSIVVIGFTTNKELFPVQMAGTATGLINLFPFAGGAIFQPFLGYLLEQHGRVGESFTVEGYKSAFLALFISGIIALVSSFLFKETYVVDS